MSTVASELERYLEARLQSGASRLGNPELLSTLLALAKETGARTALDVGSGCGDLVAQLWREGIHATGLELCPSLLERARSKVPQNAPLLQGDAQTLKFPGEQFDLVTSALVLHYLERPETALAEAYRVLKPGGWLLLADRVASPVPALRAIHERIERLRNPAFQRIFSPEELEAILSQARFSVLKSISTEEDVPLESWLSGTSADRASEIHREISGLSGADLGGLRFDARGSVRLRIRTHVARKK